MTVLLLTGTPGTGKSTVAKELSKLTGFKLISIEDVVGEDYLYVEDGSKVVEPSLISKKISQVLEGACIVEGHLSQSLDIEGVVVVLRTEPETLRKRLIEKGFSESKLEENVEAEALDICLIESVDRFKKVYEIDTTHKKPLEVAELILNILEGDSAGFKPGGVSWLEDYLNSKM